MLLDLLFPRRCVGCGKEGRWICQECGKNLTTAAALEQRGEVTALYPFEYPLVREALHHLKYNGIREMADELLHLTGQWQDIARLLPPETRLVPVPISKSRLKERGYNQAELLAAALSRLTNLPLADLLERRGGRSLVGKSAAEREQAAGEVFRLRAGIAVPKTVVVVDDVMTTGSTLQACLRQLRLGGAVRAGGIVVASKH